jgi:hypothetical protein
MAMSQLERWYWTGVVVIFCVITLIIVWANVAH